MVRNFIGAKSPVGMHVAAAVDVRADGRQPGGQLAAIDQFLATEFVRVFRGDGDRIMTGDQEPRNRSVRGENVAGAIELDRREFARGRDARPGRVEAQDRRLRIEPA